MRYENLTIGRGRIDELYLGDANGREGSRVSFVEQPGQIYYVDGNRSTTGNGKSWATAYKTLSEGLAASHANIALTAARNWAGRNTIYLKADSITEDLILFADKTDVVGVGAKDSYDMPCIVGNHVPAANGLSTRFFNVQFRGDLTAGADIMTLDSSNEGIVFNGCQFEGWSTTPATGGIVATASPRLRIENCKFLGAFSDAAIELGAGDGNGTVIVGNIIQSAAIGIKVDSSFTCANEQAFINDNRIFCSGSGLIIDENSDKIGVFGNYGCCVAGAFGATSHDLNVKMAAGNIFTGSDVTGTVPFATIA